MVADERTSIAALPMPLRWLTEPQSWSIPDATSLLVDAGPRTDWFVDPQLSAEPTLNAPALVGDPSGDFLLSARVTVDFAATYDAGVLALYASDRIWAKLCFEYSPQREPMVVSVVTRGVSDDCNSFVVDGPRSGFESRASDRRSRSTRRPTASGGASSATSRSRPAPSRRSGSPPSRRRAKGAPSRSSRSRYEAARLGDLRSGE